MKIVDPIEEVITRLTLEQKAGLLSGKNAWETLGFERLEIPSLRLSDGPHGLRTVVSNDMTDQEAIQATCFPPEATIACSFNRDLAYKMGAAIGEEALKNKVAILLGPGLNIKRSPLGGRNFEYYSEDPYLTGEMGAAFVKGLQSKNVGACVKHFACNSQEDFRFSTDSLVDERALREIYLEGFRKVVTEASPAAIMGAYNKVNGVYACENPVLLRDILRQEWGFKGIVISDWGATNDRVAALKAGLDLEMPSSRGYNDLKVYQALNRSLIDGIVIDEAIVRLLTVAEKYGANEARPYPEMLHHELAYEIAKDSFVLLKNDGILPLNARDNFIVVGDLAVHPHIQGGGSSKVSPFYVNNPLYELKKMKERLTYCEGYSSDPTRKENLIAQAVEAAKNADSIVLFVGLTDESESEGADRFDLALPGDQIDLYNALYRVNKNIIVVLQAGCVVDLSFAEEARAILDVRLLGQAGAKAVAETLLGEANPSGKTTETYPFKLSDVPNYKFYPGGVHHSYFMESIYVGYRYYDSYRVAPRYPFGYGLSYTTFAIRADNLIRDDDTITIPCVIQNTGKYAGAEVLQVYIRNKSKKDYYAFQELKAFTKVYLAPGEEKKVVLTVPIKEFKYFDTTTKKFEIESGAYEAALGTSSRDIIRVYQLVIDGTINRPTPSDVSSCYFTRANFNEQDFRKLLGTLVLPKQTIDYAGDYSLNTTLYEIKRTTIGKTIYKQAKQVAAKSFAMDERLTEKALDSITLRFAAMGGPSLGQMEGVVDMLNGKMVKGYRKFRRKEEVSLNGKA